MVQVQVEVAVVTLDKLFCYLNDYIRARWFRRDLRGLSFWPT